MFVDALVRRELYHEAMVALFLLSLFATLWPWGNVGRFSITELSFLGGRSENELLSCESLRERMSGRELLLGCQPRREKGH